MVSYSNPVLPNLCATAHKCARRVVEVCRGRMSEIKKFSMRSFNSVFNCHWKHLPSWIQPRHTSTAQS